MMSIADQIQGILLERGEQHIYQLVDLIYPHERTQYARNVIWSVLRELRKSGEVVKVHHGAYRLS